MLCIASRCPRPAPNNDSEPVLPLLNRPSKYLSIRRLLLHCRLLRLLHRRASPRRRPPPRLPLRLLHRPRQRICTPNCSSSSSKPTPCRHRSNKHHQPSQPSSPNRPSPRNRPNLPRLPRCPRRSRPRSPRPPSAPSVRQPTTPRIHRNPSAPSSRTPPSWLILACIPLGTSSLHDSLLPVT